MMYSGHGYFVPLAIYLREEHPNSPPICVVTPTPEMTVKPNHRHVDVQGIVYLPYLHDWNKRSSLVDMVNALSSVFSSDPFIYKKPQPAASPSPSSHNPPYQNMSHASPAPTKLAPSYGTPQMMSPQQVTRTQRPPQNYQVDKSMSKQLSTSMMSKAREMEELDSVLENSFRC